MQQRWSLCLEQTPRSLQQQRLQCPVVQQQQAAAALLVVLLLLLAAPTAWQLKWKWLMQCCGSQQAAAAATTHSGARVLIA
jgi:hypothetical protein